MKHIFFAALLLCAATFVAAQKAVIPGYQGHRLAVEASYRTMWNHSVSEGNFTAPTDGVSKGWYKEFGVAATYAISRRNSVQLGIETGRTGYIDDDYVLETPFQGPLPIEIWDKINYTTLHAGINFNFRRSWAYAPIGPYWGIRVSYSLGKSTMDQYRISGSGPNAWNPVSELPVAASVLKSYKFATPSIAIPLGTRFIPYERVTIDLGILMTLTKSIKENLFEPDYDLSVDEQRRADRKYLLFLTQGWRLGVSAGYLF